MAVPLMAIGCGNGGWLPSLTFSMAGIRRGRVQEKEAEREFLLRANANLSWRLRASSGDAAEPVADHRGAAPDHGYAPCATQELCEWEARERGRAYRAALAEGE
jgi:hypothetical protein